MLIQMLINIDIVVHVVVILNFIIGVFYEYTCLGFYNWCISNTLENKMLLSCVYQKYVIIIYIMSILYLIVI